LFLLVLLSSAFAAAQQELKPLTIPNIFAEGGLTGRAPETVKWSPDGTKVSFVQRDDPGEHGELWYVDVATGEKKVLVSESKLAQLSPPESKIKDEREKERVTRYHVAEYIWAPDSKHILFDSQGQLWLYDLASGTAVQYTSAPEPSGDPKFSPDGSRLAYIRGHNLYVHAMTGSEGEKQITKDKDENILNGEVDWVYAEELSVRSNYFWSPDSKEILLMQMDETHVPTYPITDWLPIHPHVDQERYPKAGDQNPSVRLGVVSAGGGKIRWITPTEENDIYIPRFGWMRDGWVWVEVMNRAQDKMDLYFIDSRSGKARKVLTESSPDAWVNVNDDFKILKSGDRFVWSSWRDGHTHLYLYSFAKEEPLLADAKLERQLDRGDYEVLQLEGVDDAAGTIFFTSNSGDPRQTRLFSVKLDGSPVIQLSTGEGTYDAEFADDSKHYVETYSNITSTPKMSVCAIGGVCASFWQSRSVADYHLAEWKFLQFQAEDGTALYGKLLMPPNAAPGSKVPLIVDIYGGPAAQTVTNAWGGGTQLFHELLARDGFAIFSVDNRGTPNRGRKFSAAIRHQFGGVELRDQMAALNSLYSQYPQLDRDRTGMWGWSNGASMTLYTLTHSTAFKAGIAVAPVTSWRNYDSIYTERYMGLPKDDPQGYGDSDLAKAAKDLHGALLLVHGTSDDNVHFQNSIQVINAFINADKQFRLMVYPNKTHGIAGPAARTHLFEMMQEHWNRELK
jgi:dipeptidyl-peptidase-4